ncbi:hypothetical protein B0T14DRAFT_88256 [Immersiella caudata]|uniref:Uncharacterized protein n=1 Tax=Immersiella caudata TaxID=314043 RepID=A0AA40C5W9_9PEZI|nr:hypothetical protein B0T14DRAFT_88256 [Immersiella caudata]
MSSDQTNGEALSRLIPSNCFHMASPSGRIHVTNTRTLALAHSRTHRDTHTGGAVFSLTATVPNILSMYPNYFHVLAIICPFHHHHASALPPIPPIHRSRQPGVLDTMSSPNRSDGTDRNKANAEKTMQTRDMKPTSSRNAWSKSVLPKAKVSSRKAVIIRQRVWR